ncbi:MAG TPA: glucuronate isomerase [Bacteroidales bacterium]|nr:glucuronate isomerase [Bacteroidales bacterium]
MKPFIHENFLLNNKKAEKLYHNYAENQPIIDFHCHLSPAMIANDYQFENLTQAWLQGDHYKWRAMRMNGINEIYCTGNEPDRIKFEKWAETVPSTAGNPLYHWTHLELARYFNITNLLSPSTAHEIFNQTSALLKTREFSVRSLITKMNVELICTTDDPTDTLEYHQKLKEAFQIKILPTFRPDNIIKTDDPEIFISYISKLEQIAGAEIKNFDALVEIIDKRHKYFHDMGCRLTDHGLDRFHFTGFTISEVDSIFRKLLDGENISADESEKYKTAILLEICMLNHKRNWTQQFHIGALRNNNARMFMKMGPDTGWDSIGSVQDPKKMSDFLNMLDKDDKLARTILYNLNPAENEMMITMAGNFNDGSSAGKVQYGPAWWFLDQKNGMEKHFKDVASLGLLRRFIGMVTDSRSFLSYPRHEYFRRILCNYVGDEVEKGLIPDDEELLKTLIEGVSYKNAKEYLAF